MNFVDITMLIMTSSAIILMGKTVFDSYKSIVK